MENRSGRNRLLMSTGTAFILSASPDGFLLPWCLIGLAIGASQIVRMQLYKSPETFPFFWARKGDP